MTDRHRLERMLPWMLTVVVTGICVGLCSMAGPAKAIDFHLCAEASPCPGGADTLTNGSGGDGFYESGDEFDVWFGIDEYTDGIQYGGEWRIAYEGDCLLPLTSTTEWLTQPVNPATVNVSAALERGPYPELDTGRRFGGYNCSRINNPVPGGAELVSRFLVLSGCPDGEHVIYLNFGFERECNPVFNAYPNEEDELRYYVPEPDLLAGLLAGCVMLAVLLRLRR